jgi:hypothetical protein
VTTKTRKANGKNGTLAERRAAVAKTMDTLSKSRPRAQVEAAAAQSGLLPKAKVAKVEKAVGQKCMCGCNGVTKGGRFLMGHDAKLKSRLINAVLDPKTHVETKRDAQAQLGKLGWTEFLDKSRKSREAREKKSA